MPVPPRPVTDNLITSVWGQWVHDSLAVSAPIPWTPVLTDFPAYTLVPANCVYLRVGSLVVAQAKATMTGGTPGGLAACSLPVPMLPSTAPMQWVNGVGLLDDSARGYPLVGFVRNDLGYPVEGRCQFMIGYSAEAYVRNVSSSVALGATSTIYLSFQYIAAPPAV